ncbi:hypothetical protein [Amycolatopsis sp. WGS_07]|uniref:hypothetical protein n=1 Tax=Amycolatopsis sp. WGS_07 TaxID=3076764 RepID=UPI003872E01B
MTAVLHDSEISPLAQAMKLHAFLLGGGQLGPVGDLPGLALDPGEYTVGTLGAVLGYARLRSAVPQPARPGTTTVIAGDYAHVAGWAMGAALRGTLQVAADLRSRAPRWCPQPLVAAALTTRRLWTEVIEAGQPRRHWVNYEMVTGMRLAGDRLELHFVHATSMALTGPWAPWCAALVAHYRYGAWAAQAVPSLNSVLPYR